MIDRVMFSQFGTRDNQFVSSIQLALRTSPVLFFVIGSESINRLVYVSCICLNVKCEEELKLSKDTLVLLVDV